MQSDTTDDRVGPGPSGGPRTGPPENAEPADAELPTSPPPAIPPYSSTSGDELSVLLSQSLEKPKPDPMLGSFSKDNPAPVEYGAPDAPVAQVDDQAVPHESFDAIGVLNAFTDPTPVRPVVEPKRPADPVAGDRPQPSPIVATPLEGLDTPGSFDALAAPVETPFAAENHSAASTASTGPQGGSFDAFPALDLSAPPSTSAKSKPKHEDDEDEDDEDELPRGRSSALTTLLISYASAVTLALVWVLVSGRRLKESDEPDVFPATDTRPDPGRRADQSRKIVPPPPIAADRLTTLGKPIRIGALEVTPLEVVAGSVTLNRVIGDAESKDGGNDALKLSLRLKNVSTDTIFAPLDEAFLRERERDVLDSLIETSSGQIEMFPMAVTSEWSIVGQEFKELKPGESWDAVVVSATDTKSRLTPEMTWRVRLRTGVNETDTIGVRFHDSDIKPEP